jgi:hypothetical protein
MSNEINKNMAIWEAVEKTDPSATKAVNQRGGYTSICATYQAMRATELWGAYGLGWGLKSINYDYSMLEATKMIFCHAVFFYLNDGKEVTFPLSNAINPMMGAKPDEDFFKKVETNTISKALSRLGFSADVFMGMFDDVEYVQQVKAEEAIAKAEDKDAEVAKQKQEMIEYIERNTETLKESKSINETKGIAKTVLRKLELQGKIPSLTEICKRGTISVKSAYEQKIIQLEQNNDSTT